MNKSNKNKVKTEGQISQQELLRQKEIMREKVQNVELQARYWKAQYDLRYYTLEAEKLQTPYLEYIREQQAVQEELNKQYEENIAKLKTNPELTIEALQKDIQDADTGQDADVGYTSAVMTSVPVDEGEKVI